MPVPVQREVRNAHSQRVRVLSLLNELREAARTLSFDFFRRERRMQRDVRGEVESRGEILLQ